jgi:hypothetical protein
MTTGKAQPAFSAPKGPCDTRPARNGWAPGSYMAICCKCKETVWAAKRSIKCADCAYAEPLWSGTSRQMPATYPADLTPALRDVLGMMFETGPIAHGFRAAGHDIPNKVEAEQAFVLHWLIKLALEHGDGWRKIAGDQLAEIIAKAKAA